MSTSSELRGVIIKSVRDIDSQLMTLRSFLTQLEAMQAKINANFAESQESYGQTMLAQVQETKQQINKSIDLLMVAKEKLLGIRL